MSPLICFNRVILFLSVTAACLSLVLIARVPRHLEQSNCNLSFLFSPLDLQFGHRVFGLLQALNTFSGIVCQSSHTNQHVLLICIDLN